MRLTELSLLHPRFRSASRSLEQLLVAAKIPLRRFEGARTPDRQLELFLQTRVPIVKPPHVTFTKPWQSRHQFGLAEDWVFWVNNTWSWVEPEHGMWAKYWELAHSVDLEPLKFEAPHVQLAGMDPQALAAGDYPTGGDSSWATWLDAQIHAWGHEQRLVHGFTIPGAPAEYVVPPAPPVARPPIILPPGLLFDEGTGMCRIDGTST